MAVNQDIATDLAEIARRQPDDAANLDESSSKGFSIRFKGCYTDLESAASEYAQGAVVEGDKVLKSWDLQQRPGGMGVLTLHCVPKTEITSGATSTSTPYKTTWTVRGVRNDKSILAYCGGAAKRENLELWMKETDTEALEQEGYRKSDGTIEPLNSVEQMIAGKIKAGIESVMRFYPVVTRKKYYHAFPVDNFSGLCVINSLPSGAPNVNGSWDWLKCQDDCEEDGEGWVRVESWMGAPTAEGGWDEDLYGTSRWAMPLQV